MENFLRTCQKKFWVKKCNVFFSERRSARYALRSETLRRDLKKILGGRGGGAPQRFFYVFINFIKKFWTNVRFQNMNYLLTIVLVHHVNPVMDPGIFGEGLASAMSQWLWSTKTPTTTATPNTTFASFPTACGTGGICGIGDATVYLPQGLAFSHP